MYQAIQSDYIHGVIDSLRIDKIISKLSNPKLKHTISKICMYNIFFHVVPTVIMSLLKWVTSAELVFLTLFVTCTSNILSTLFHILHYIDIIEIVRIYTPKSSKNVEALGLFSLTIVMTIYQIIVYLTIIAIDIIFHDRL